MSEEKAEQQNITLYPSQIEKVERFMSVKKIRKFSQAIQRIIDELPEPEIRSDAEKPDTNGDAVAVGNIGAR
jgi:hypothetical protein